jgi:DNA ligase 1
MRFYDFAQLGEQLAATTKKLAKAALLKEYLAALADADLALAARFLAGRPFALADERVLNVGWAVVRDVVCELSGMASEVFAALATQRGEAGEAAEIALAGHVAGAGRGDGMLHGAGRCAWPDAQAPAAG